MAKSFDFFTSVIIFIGLEFKLHVQALCCLLGGKLQPNWNWAYFISLEESQQHVVSAYAEK